MSANPQRPVHGLVLAGGHSTRMTRDKALLSYAGETQLERAMRLLAGLGIPAWVSVRPDQTAEPARARHPQVIDAIDGAGPAAGILAAQAHTPDAAWLVLACDLPFLDAATLGELLHQRDPTRLATAFRSAHDGLPEPLCAIYEPASREPLRTAVANGNTCPRRFLKRAAAESAVALLTLPRPEALDNVNTPDERTAAAQRLERSAPRAVRVQYFALLREQAGCAEETVQSAAATPRELLEQLRVRHRFTLPTEMLKVAVNGDFADWDLPLQPGDAVVFIPPVAGG
jgi:molybdopterin-guanine dinucleotide biosynthesis protein A/molybdopterin converting factor small subunit